MEKKLKRTPTRVGEEEEARLARTLLPEGHGLMMGTLLQLLSLNLLYVAARTLQGPP